MQTINHNLLANLVAAIFSSAHHHQSKQESHAVTGRGRRVPNTARAIASLMAGLVADVTNRLALRVAFRRNVSFSSASVAGSLLVGTVACYVALGIAGAANHIWWGLGAVASHVSNLTASVALDVISRL